MPPRSNSRASSRRSAGIEWPANPAIASWPACRRTSRTDIRRLYRYRLILRTVAGLVRTVDPRTCGTAEPSASSALWTPQNPYNAARAHRTSAPTRIDLAGGTLDIWPLYLFHDGAQTLNAAISLRAHCTIAPRTDRRIVIVSDDTGRRVEAAHWSELRDNHELRLLGRLLHHFQAEGLELRTRSESPVGAGIAGSSALNIAVCGALAPGPAALGRGAAADRHERRGAGHRRADRRPGLPAGALTAVFPRSSSASTASGGSPCRSTPAELEQRLVLAYTDASRNSGINNWEITKRHIDGDRACRCASGAFATSRASMREALERADWPTSAATSPTNGRTARSSRPASPPRRSTRCSRAAATAGALRRQGLRGRRRRLPVLHRRARRRAGHPPRPRAAGAPDPRLPHRARTGCASRVREAA